MLSKLICLLFASLFASLFTFATHAKESQRLFDKANFKFPRQGILASTDTPTHMAFVMGDSNNVDLIYSTVRAMNKNVVPIVLFSEKITTIALNEVWPELKKTHPHTLMLPVRKKHSASYLIRNPNWARDLLPELVVRGDQRDFVGFRYHRGDTFAHAAQLALASHFGIPLKRVNLILEGGAYRRGPDNVLYISEKVLANNTAEGLAKIAADKQSDLSREFVLQPRSKNEIESLLRESLNVNEIVWIETPPRIIESTGHADMYFQFLSSSEKKVVVVKGKADGDSSSESFLQSLELANRVFDDIASMFESRGFTVIRQDVISVPGTLYTTTNSVFDGNLYLTTNLDVRSQMRVGFKTDSIYARWGVKARTVGPFGTIVNAIGGGIHCLTHQYNLNSQK
jgi:Porphyromonas-type peptidyl-arginine deiminase